MFSVFDAILIIVSIIYFQISYIISIFVFSTDNNTNVWQDYFNVNKSSEL